jgi:hypothetical protein
MVFDIVDLERETQAAAYLRWGHAYRWIADECGLF